MRIYVLIITILCLVGCNKPNPNPELTDDIYLDLKSEAEAAKKDVEAEQKKFEGFKKDLETNVPQTGTIKYAQKRYFESEAKVQKLEQVAKYFELKAETRRKFSRISYIKAFKDGKPWPSPEETEDYKKYKVLGKNTPSWDSRKRIDAYEKENGIVSTKKVGESGAKSEKKAESKPAE